MDTEIIAVTIKKCELFGDLSEQELKSIAGSAVMEKYGAGESIYEQGNVGQNFYILVEGQVSLQRTMPLGKTARANVTVFVQRETPFRRLMGCWSALVGAEHRHLCTAKCDRPTTVIRIPCAALSAIVEKNPELKIKLLEKLVLMLRERIDSSYQAIETL